jgi:hypothetical protein
MNKSAGMTLSLFLLILSVAGVEWSEIAFAACLNGHLSPEQEYQVSPTVFMGRVVSEEFTLESKNDLDGIEYAVQVEEVLRGAPTKTVKIFSENSSGRFPMRIGTTYLIFTYEDLNRVRVDNCGNSGEAIEKAEVLAMLRKLKR